MIARARILLLLPAVALLWGGCCHTVTPVSESGWRPLFDGTSLDGWKMTGPGELKLEQGELVTHGGMGLLWYSREKLGDCEVRIRFQLSAKDDNSGVFIRIPEPPSDPWYAVNHGYEVQIANTGDDRHRTGCLYSLTTARNKVDARIHEWSTMLIRLEGLRTVVSLDGQLITDYTEGEPVPPKKNDTEPDRGLRPNRGYIGLQNHGEPARVHFQNVSVRPLTKSR